MKKIYIDSIGNVYYSIPRSIPTSNGAVLSIPLGFTDERWESLPGCTIDYEPPTLEDVMTDEEKIQNKIKSLNEQYPYVDEKNPGIVLSARKIIQFITSAIQNGAELPLDRVPTFSELVSQIEYFDPTEAIAMLALHKEISMRVGGDQVAYDLLKPLAMFNPSN